MDSTLSLVTRARFCSQSKTIDMVKWQRHERQNPDNITKTIKCRSRKVRYIGVLGYRMSKNNGEFRGKKPKL